MSDTEHEVAEKPRWLVPLVIGGSFLSLVVAGRFRRKRGVRTEWHDHGALVHDHIHVHVTHNRTDPKQGVGGWEHLTANHSHLHNHAPMAHNHRPHRDFSKEHSSEAHVHDHEDPVSES